MKKIYKYYTINDYFLSSLEESYFWLTDPLDLNDPFEAYVEYYTAASDEEKIAWAKKKNLINPRNTSITDAESLKIAEEVLVYQKEKRNEYERKERRSFGICAFTTKPKNFLMWSHYGNSHKGVCIGYECYEKNDEVYPFLTNKLEIPLYKVRYKKFSSRYDFLRENTKEYKDCIFEKHPNWSYENEYRLVMVNSRYQEDKDLRKTFYQKTCIKEIIFGCKTDEKSIKIVLDKIKDFNIIPDKIRKLKLNPKSMQLIFDPEFE